MGTVNGVQCESLAEYEKYAHSTADVNIHRVKAIHVTKPRQLLLGSWTRRLVICHDVDQMAVVTEITLFSAAEEIEIQIDPTDSEIDRRAELVKPEDEDVPW